MALDFLKSEVLPLHPDSAGNGKDSEQRKKSCDWYLTRKLKGSDLCTPFHSEAVSKERWQKKLAAGTCEEATKFATFAARFETRAEQKLKDGVNKKKVAPGLANEEKDFLPLQPETKTTKRIALRH